MLRNALQYKVLIKEGEIEFRYFRSINFRDHTGDVLNNKLSLFLSRRYRNLRGEGKAMFTAYNSMVSTEDNAIFLKSNSCKKHMLFGPACPGKKLKSW